MVFSGPWPMPEGAVLLPAAVLLPFLSMLIGLTVGGPWLRRIALATIPMGLAITLGIAAAWTGLNGPVTYPLGGWEPPLGIALRADGPAVAMLVAVALVVCGIAIFARNDFGPTHDPTETRASFTYWLLLLSVWGALNLVFLSGDLFTLYVALELLTFAGVPLVCLAGTGETLRAALRYMLFALCGSVLYLLGAVLLYGGYGTLDMPLLAAAIRAEPIVWTALSLMTVGLLAKTALFPLHLWLPPAHGGAPAAASAALSALVIKGSWFLVLRLWFDVMPGVITFAAAQLLATLGALAILVGSIVALRQERLKLLVAYSTMAQIGYLFLMFPLAYHDGRLTAGVAMSAGVLQAMSHATAKAGMFMSAGLVYAALGHDRIRDLGGAARAMPLTLLAFAVSGVALMGVVPSGAYVAKKLLLNAAEESSQWWWIAVLQGGAAFTASYVALVLVSALRHPQTHPAEIRQVPMVPQWAALGLALASLFLAWFPLQTEGAGLIKHPLAPTELANTLVVVLAGVLLAWGLARSSPWSGKADSPWRSVTTRLGMAFELFDNWVRRWTIACLFLIVLGALFFFLLRVGQPQ